MPGICAGDINSNTSEIDLIRIYGKENVKRDSVSVGGGEYEVGTILFSNTKNEISILWKNNQTFSNPQRIYFRTQGTSWKTHKGISIGTKMTELETLNGKPFTMLGLGWEYAGTVIDWNNGNLESDHPLEGAAQSQKGIILRLSSESYVEAVTGDKVLSTSNKTLQQLNPQVYEMIIVL